MQYIYTTSIDEDQALELELAKANGQLASQGQQVLNAQGLFTLFVSQKLFPLTHQVLLSQASPLVDAYVKADAPTRQQILASVVKP